VPVAWSLQCCFEDDLNPRHDLMGQRSFLQRRCGINETLVEFARELLGRRPPAIAPNWIGCCRDSPNWSLERWPVTDPECVAVGKPTIALRRTPPRVASTKH